MQSHFNFIVFKTLLGNKVSEETTNFQYHLSSKTRNKINHHSEEKCLSLSLFLSLLILTLFTIRKEAFSLCDLVLSRKFVRQMGDDNLGCTL